MLSFELDVYYGDGISPTAGDTAVRAAAAQFGVQVAALDPCGPAGGNPCYRFDAPGEAAAFALIDALYGREAVRRTESNHFFVYGAARR